MNNRKYNNDLKYIKIASRIRNCYMGLQRLVTGQRQGTFMGCHSPMCAICQNGILMRELAISNGVFDKVMANGEYEGVKWYHWVLATESCSNHELLPVAQHLRDGVKRLFRMPEVERVLLGASVYLHVKLKDAYGQIKPHYHVVVAMKPSFKGKRFISMSKLTLLWQEAMGVGYLPFTNTIPLPLTNGYPDRRDFINLIAYSSRCIKVDDIREYPETYLDYTHQAFGLRKVRHVGIMAELRRAVRSDYQERLAQIKASAADGDVVLVGIDDTAIAL